MDSPLVGAIDFDISITVSVHRFGTQGERSIHTMTLRPPPRMYGSSESLTPTQIAVEELSIHLQRLIGQAGRLQL